MQCELRNPCALCSRVPCPEECENIHCNLWRRWFLARWDRMQQAARRQMNTVETVPLGVPLGGRNYAPPHRVREYRQHNPCQNCVIGPICKEKCNIRTRWEQQGGLQ